MISTYCDWHLGDQMIHLNWLRRVALRHPDKSFAHGAPAGYLAQLYPLVLDVPNIMLCSTPLQGAVDVWKNRRGDFYNHPLRNDWVRYHLQFFAELARDLDVDNPVQTSDDMLFDYPALLERDFGSYDCLVVNSRPQSNQFRSFNDTAFDILVKSLLARGLSVITTGPNFTGAPSTLGAFNAPLSVTEIGALSRNVKAIIGVPTGPIWATFNIWNRETPRTLMLDEERIHLCANTRHVASIGDAIEALAA